MKYENYFFFVENYKKIVLKKVLSLWIVKCLYILFDNGLLVCKIYFLIIIILLRTLFRFLQKITLVLINLCTNSLNWWSYQFCVEFFLNCTTYILFVLSLNKFATIPSFFTKSLLPCLCNSAIKLHCSTSILNRAMFTMLNIYT